MNTRLLTGIEKNSDKSFIDGLAKTFSMTETAIKLLIAKGLDDETKISTFLSPSINDFFDPFLLTGMREAVDRIQQAIEACECVVIYGDYDADGICSTAILTKFLVAKGLKVFPFIPSRLSDGYGISDESLEKIIEDIMPDLIITCDCGISAAAQVETILDAGIDVIVSDHHEAPEKLPDCVCVNPKISGQNYPFNGLCGAGVVLKIIQAIDGIENSIEYLDLACLATVADMMPLISENRLIVLLGLDRINSNKCNFGLKTLINNLDNGAKLTARDIAFKVSPRINAAGRMGDAYRAFNLLLTESVVEAKKLITDINNDNEKRKELCKAIYNEAVDFILESDSPDDRAIILSNPNWEKGLTSIVAAQLAGEFNKPTFLMAKFGDCYKGTARGIEGVNVYELLKNCGNLLIEYGGHEQAAGFSIKYNNILKMKERINNYLTKLNSELFSESLYYDLKLNEDEYSLKLAKDIEKFEPFGNGNKRPVFCTEMPNCECAFMKNKNIHLNLKAGKLNIVAFNYGDYYNLFNTKTSFELCIEAGINNYNNNESLNIILKGFNFKKLGEPKQVLSTKLCYLQTVNSKNSFIKPHYIKSSEVAALLKINAISGTLIIAYKWQSYIDFIENYGNDFINYFKVRTTLNNRNAVVLSPLEKFNCYGYNNIIFLDEPLIKGKHNLKISEFSNVSIIENNYDILSNYNFNRDTFIDCFNNLKTISQDSRNYAGDIITYFAALNTSTTEKELLILAYTVFNELQIMNWNAVEGKIVINNQIKKSLQDSTIFNTLFIEKKECLTS